MFHQELLTRITAASKSFLTSYAKGDEYLIPRWDMLGAIFVSMQLQFLAYAPLIVQCDNLIKRIEEFLSYRLLSEEIKQLENFMREESEKSVERHQPISIRSMLTFPMQHLMR